MNQNQVPIKSTCNACGGEGVLATGKIFTLAITDYPIAQPLHRRLEYFLCAAVPIDRHVIVLQ